MQRRGISAIRYQRSGGKKKRFKSRKLKGKRQHRGAEDAEFAEKRDISDQEARVRNSKSEI